MTASDQLHQDRVEELIRGNSHIKQKEIAVAFGISKERVGHIIGVLGFQKFFARWVPRNKRCNSTPDFSLLPHPPYGPDQAPSDFHLFPKLKEHLKGQCFSRDEEVKSAVRKWFRKQNTNFFKDGFQKLVQHWRKCTEVRGDFVEK